MALSPLTSSDVGAPARDKINLAITEADKVGGIGAALAALQITLAPYLDLVGGTPNRPGDSRTLFTRQMTGAPKLRPAIDKGTVENGGELGQVLRISGADTDPGLGYIDVAPRRAYYMRPGRAYLVRHAFARFQDPTDPEQNAVELRFQNLSASSAQVSNVRFGNAYAPAVTDGPLFVDTFIGKAGAPGTPSYVVPPSSAYGVPFFRVYGNGHQTDLGEVWLYDVSDALAGGADIASIIARVARLEVTQSANVIFATSWADLAGRTGRVAGAGAEVPDSDTGTHTDPITGAANTPNAGRYQWSVSPAGWRWVSVTTAKQAADFVGAGITTSALTNAPALQLAFRDPATNRLTVLSPADTKSFIQGLTMDPVTYPYYPTLKADLVSRVVLPADADRFSVGFQADTVDLAVNINFQKATFDGSTNSKIIYAGNYEQFKRDVTGPISVAARVPPGTTAPTPAPINFATVGRLTASAPPSTKLTGDDRMSYWPDQSVDIRLRNALRTALNNLDDSPNANSNTLQKITLIGLMCGSSRANNAINLANPSGPAFSYKDGASGAIVTVPYGYTQGNGTDQYIETGLSPAALGMTADGHFMAAKVDGNAIVGSRYIMGNSPNYFLNPNRTETLAGFKTGSGLDTANAAPGSWIALNRSAIDTYDQFVGDAKVATVTRSLGGLPTSTMTLLATAGAAPTALPLRIAIAGYGFQSPGTVTKIIQEFSAVLAVCDQIRTGG